VPTIERAGPPAPLYPALEAALADRGSTDADRLATAIGYSRQGLDALRAGHTKPTRELQLRIAAIVGIPADELFVPNPAVAYVIGTAVEQGVGEVVTDPASYRRTRAILRAA